eukprot:3751621-Pleurochrysis_carterae.AAC.2
MPHLHAGCISCSYVASSLPITTHTLRLYQAEVCRCWPHACIVAGAREHQATARKSHFKSLRMQYALGESTSSLATARDVVGCANHCLAEAVQRDVLQPCASVLLNGQSNRTNAISYIA